MNNYWIALPVSIKQEAERYLSSPETYTPSEDISKMYCLTNLLIDFKGTGHMFKSYQNKDLYSLYGESGDIEEILLDFPQTVLLGSWDMEGNIISPLDPDILEYVPNIQTSEGEIVTTDLSQVIILSSQKVRNLI